MKYIGTRQIENLTDDRLTGKTHVAGVASEVNLREHTLHLTPQLE